MKGATAGPDVHMVTESLHRLKTTKNYAPLLPENCRISKRFGVLVFISTQNLKMERTRMIGTFSEAPLISNELTCWFINKRENGERSTEPLCSDATEEINTITSEHLGEAVHYGTDRS